MKWLRKMAAKQSAAEAGKSGDDRGDHRREKQEHAKQEHAKQDRPDKADIRRKKVAHSDDPVDRDRERKEAMKRKAMEPARDGGRKERAGVEGEGSEVRQLRGALHTGDAALEKKRQALEEQVGKGLDRAEAARRIRALEDEWRSRRESIKGRLRELAGND